MYEELIDLIGAVIFLQDGTFSFQQPLHCRDSLSSSRVFAERCANAGGL